MVSVTAWADLSGWTHVTKTNWVTLLNCSKTSEYRSCTPTQLELCKWIIWGMNLLQSRPWSRFKLCTSCSATWEVERIDKPSNSKSKLLKKLLTNRIQLTYTIWRIWTHLFSFRTWICDLSACAGSSYPSPQFSSFSSLRLYLLLFLWEVRTALGVTVRYICAVCCKGVQVSEWMICTNNPSFRLLICRLWVDAVCIN